METSTKIFFSVAIFFSAIILFSFTPVGRGIINNYVFQVQQVDNATNYKTLKNVEDTCRAMISSYEADLAVYNQYKDSDNEEKQGWGEQAKMRANRTASTYNNFIKENSFVWKNNVPADINYNLAIID